LVDIPPKESAGDFSNGAGADKNEGGTLYSPWIVTEGRSSSFSSTATGSAATAPSDAGKGEQKSRQPSHDINSGEELSVAVVINNEAAANTFTRYTSEG
jgi:hypothetical protein